MLPVRLKKEAKLGHEELVCQAQEFGFYPSGR
jgi:hypothetical protein